LAAIQKRIEGTERALQSAADELQRERRIAEKLQKLIGAGKLRVHTRAGRLALELPGDIHFASGRADLTEDGKATLKDVARVLQDEKDRLFVVEGHTDNVPIAVSGFRSNWQLGAARAEISREALVLAGLDAQRVAIATWADLLPACPEVDDKVCRQRNRRVEVLLLPRFE
jgi:chemotaxis protein MotB